jgi:hypothetical protein
VRGVSQAAQGAAMTITASSTTASRIRLDLAPALLLIVGGAAFFASGPLHPKGSDEGDKTEQLRSMLVDSLWFPAHAVGLLGFACIAAGLLAVRRQRGLPDRARRPLAIASVTSVVATAGALVHLLAGTQGDALEDGGITPLVGAFMGVETLVNPVWALTVVWLAAVGGVTGALGNRLLAAVGAIGGVAFALATATIAFVDTLDPLFPVAGLLGIWAIAVGVTGIIRR